MLIAGSVLPILILEADLYASYRRPHLKSVILNHVVLGRTQLMKSADQSLQHAPDIYNSVRTPILRKAAREWLIDARRALGYWSNDERRRSVGVP